MEKYLTEIADTFGMESYELPFELRDALKDILRDFAQRVVMDTEFQTEVLYSEEDTKTY